MKNCPTCHRAYEDDTLVFCLDDGARLTAAYDPQATLRGPARDTDPPRTEVLPPGLTPPNQAPRSRTNGRDSGKLWIIILVGMFAVVVVGLISVLGYLAWIANSRSSTTEPESVTSTPSPKSKAPADTNRSSESSQTDNADVQWLDGVWEGEGYQSDTKTTWAARLTVKDGTYEIEYPDIPCRGRWDLIDKNSSVASFTEVITEGTDRCGNNSHVRVEKVNDSEVSCKFTHAQSRAVIATVVLSKKAQSTETR